MSNAVLLPLGPRNVKGNTMISGTEVRGALFSEVTITEGMTMEHRELTLKQLRYMDRAVHRIY